jgi:anti-sigma B factor antagonist
VFSIEANAAGKIILTGRLDASQSAAAQTAFDNIQGIVEADCTHLEYISSAGLGVLLKTQKRLMAGGGKLRLTGVTRHIKDIFQYSGFDLIVEIEALAE